MNNLFSQSLVWFFRNIVGLEWLLPILAGAQIDSSLAALISFFLVPASIVLSLFSKWLLSRINKGSPFHLISRISRWGSIFVSMAAALYLLMINTSENQFKLKFIDPIPPSVKGIRHRGQSNAFGSSSFRMTFEINAQDFETIISTPYFSRFKKLSPEALSGRKPELYKRVLTEAREFLPEIHEFYLFEHPNSVYLFDALLTNLQHTRVYYRSY